MQAAGKAIGQNDIWIAAAAITAGFALLTTDGGFRAVRDVAKLDLCLVDNRTGIRLP
jgi:predicted nucleic acid-binding protein